MITGAFANGFNGDIVSLNHILQTLERKVVAIPGLTCSSDLSVTAKGEFAYFYKRGDASAAAGHKVGEKVDFKSTGVKREDIPMHDAIQIAAVLPMVNVSTVSADVVGDKVIQETITAANAYNEEFLKALYKAKTVSADTSTLTKDNVYDKIVDTVKEFKVKNKANGMKPTAIIVGPTTEALLLEAPQFLRSTVANDRTAYEGYIGSIAGLPVVVALDLQEGETEKLDFILINQEAFGAPQNVNSLFVVDATPAGYPGGTLISGEIGYGFAIAEESLILKRKHAA